jgi:nucleotide-binding universal stress UspA family protein
MTTESNQSAAAREQATASPLKILIGVDETDASRHAVETAWELFGSNGSYTIACIFERQPFIVGGLGVGTSVASMYAQLDDDVGRQLATNAASGARAAVPADADVNFHTDVGHAATAIIDAAEEYESDLIVIGSHDRSFWERLFSPSVGRFLVDHAPCPVLVVRSASS